MKSDYETEKRKYRFDNNSPTLFKSIITGSSASSSFSHDLTESQSSYTPPRYRPGSSTKLVACVSQQNMNETPPNTKYGLLSKNSSGEWEILLEEGLNQYPYSGPFDFVTMPSGEIRVQLNSLGQSPNHVSLSGGLEHVISAGQLYFSEDGNCDLERWNNESEDYPSEAIHENVGLPFDAYEASITKGYGVS